jgi:hypothetical protein
LAELLIADRVVRARARTRLLRALTLGFGEFQAPIEQLRADAYGNSPFTRGVLLKDADGKSAIFWCSERVQREILQALRT